MKNKGFTLVELLAVIAILAILITLVLPNVIKIFNDSKRDMFLSEAKNIYKEANRKFVNESVKGNVVSNITKENNKLSLSSDSDIDYKIRLDEDGHIIKFQVSNSSYCISGKYNDVNDITIDDVHDGECNVKYCKTTSSSTEFTDEFYTYKYKKKYANNTWQDQLEDGWGVILTNKNSKDAVTDIPCTYIDNKPVMFMSNMFMGSQAVSIDLTNINTSNVVDMEKMFYKTLNTKNSDGTNVILDVTDFDTINVTNMNGMFNECGGEIKGLDLFDTRNVRDMSNMFNRCNSTVIDVSKFNTRNVHDIGGMFSLTNTDILDLSSFDTRNVTGMSVLFSHSKAKTILFGENFKTDKVNNMTSMFEGSEATILDLSNFDLSSIKSDTFIKGMFKDAKATTGYVKNSDIASKFNDSTVTGIPDTLRFTVKN